MRFITLLAMLSCAALPNYASHYDAVAAETVNLNKSDANIFGHVIDKNTREHVSYINVILKGTTIGVATDEICLLQ